MRTAPPVDAPVSAGRLERLLSVALYAAAALAAVVGVGAAFEFDPGWPATTLAVAAAACAGAATWRAPRGHLRWDGRGWLWASASGTTQPLARLRIQLDLGRWLLVRWQVAGRRRPTWASLRAADAADWHGLRIALAAHAGAPRPEDAAA